jgi:HAE1 family hydrophobic/amphiphilic exporter-1
MQLDPNAGWPRYGIGIDEVAAGSSIKANVESADRERSTGGTSLSPSRPPGQLTEAAAYRPLIVAYRNGAPVRLDELGRVLDSVENDKVGGMDDNVRALDRAGNAAAAGHQHGGGGGQRIRKLAAGRFASELPASVNLDHAVTTARRRSAIRSTTSKFTLVLTVCLVVLVIFLFLQQHFGDGDPQPGAAHVHRGHLRRDVPARLQRWTTSR